MGYQRTEIKGEERPNFNSNTHIFQNVLSASVYTFDNYLFSWNAGFSKVEVCKALRVNIMGICSACLGALACIIKLSINDPRGSCWWAWRVIIFSSFSRRHSGSEWGAVPQCMRSKLTFFSSLTLHSSCLTPNWARYNSAGGVYAVALLWVQIHSGISIWLLPSFIIWL